MLSLPLRDFLDPDQVLHLEEHAAKRGAILLLDGLLVMAQP
jgi:hypothetical protein